MPINLCIYDYDGKVNVESNPNRNQSVFHKDSEPLHTKIASCTIVVPSEKKTYSLPYNLMSDRV